jgi:hypothetical protein
MIAPDVAGPEQPISMRRTAIKLANGAPPYSNG